MICHFCNNEIDNHARECPHCGTRFKTAVEKRIEREEEEKKAAKLAEEAAAEAEKAETVAEESAVPEMAESEQLLSATDAPSASETESDAVEEIVSSDIAPEEYDETVVYDETAYDEAAVYDEAEEIVSETEQFAQENGEVLSAEMTEAETDDAAREETSDVKSLIDEMPELHDELDRIGEMRERTKKRRHRLIFLIILLLICAGGVVFGIYYINDFKNPNRQAAETATQTQDYSVAAEVVNEMFGEGAVAIQVLDETTAKDAVNGLKSTFGISDANVDFTLMHIQQIHDITYYRFAQTYGGVEVFDGEIVMAVQDGNVIGVNGNVINFTGMNVTASLDSGAATNAISEYVKSFNDERSVKEGVSIGNVKKSVFYKDGRAYLCYRSGVSGYNAQGGYMAYDAFVDGHSGSGVGISYTVNFENETTGDASAGETTEDAEPVAEAPVKPEITAPDSRMKLYLVNDKFNWNDKSKSNALELFDTTNMDAEGTTAYISSMKQAVDHSYAYFKDHFGFYGMDGQNSTYVVYLNSHEYVENQLPPERALSVGNILMFIQKDTTTAVPNKNVVTHEYAHSVMRNVAGFDGTYAFSENAAIAEGFADVFAELAEMYTEGVADWMHTDRNLAQPQEGYYATHPGTVNISSMKDCYRYSTIISHTVYNMVANGAPADAVGHLMMKTMCMMNGESGFSEFRSIAELMATQMKNTDRLTQDQYQAIMRALETSNIHVKTRLHSTQQATLGEEFPEETPAVEPAESETEVVLEEN